MASDPAASPGPGRDAARPARERRLLEGPITPTLVRFALPLLTTNLLHAIAGTWAAIWVSHVLGPNALTAVANATIFMYMMMGAVQGIGMSAAVAIGQALGSGNPQAIKRVAGTSVSLVVGGAFAIMAAGLVLAPWMLDAMRIPEPAREAGITHLRCVFASMPSIFTFVVLMMMLRGTGDAKTPFRFSVLWIVLGIGLSPALLTGWGPFPRLGIAGVAIGGLLANVTALAAMATYIYRRRLPIALRGRDLRHLLPDPDVTRMLVRRGTPMALENLIVQGSYFALLSMVNAHGALTASAYSGAAQLWTYVQMPSNAVAAAMASMAAMNIGARKWHRVERIAREGCLVSVAFTSSACAIVYALGDAPLTLFLPDNPEALGIARHVNHVVLWGWIAVSVTSGLSGIVRANGAMAAPTIIYTMTMWVVRVPVASLAQPLLGAAAIWWSFPCGTISSALLAFCYYRWGRWRENPLLVAHPAPASAPAPAAAPTAPSSSACASPRTPADPR
jgi:putative MATE family efflux protein